jgi:hypothetical protein
VIIITALDGANYVLIVKYSMQAMNRGSSAVKQQFYSMKHELENQEQPASLQ